MGSREAQGVTSPTGAQGFPLVEMGNPIQLPRKEPHQAAASGFYCPVLSLSLNPGTVFWLPKPPKESYGPPLPALHPVSLWTLE